MNFLDLNLSSVIRLLPSVGPELLGEPFGACIPIRLLSRIGIETKIESEQRKEDATAHSHKKRVVVVLRHHEYTHPQRGTCRLAMLAQSKNVQ